MVSAHSLLLATVIAFSPLVSQAAPAVDAAGHANQFHEVDQHRFVYGQVSNNGNHFFFKISNGWRLDPLHLRVHFIFWMQMEKSWGVSPVTDGAKPLSAAMLKSATINSMLRGQTYGVVLPKSPSLVNELPHKEAIQEKASAPTFPSSRIRLPSSR